ncbi:MAG: protein-L-isoaspartate O-methyltransferase family protein [Pseudorhodobacter sp.]
MTDFSSRRTMMVDTQVRPSDVTKFPIIEAMLAVPREVYVPQALREAAYMGENLDLGGDRVILEPRSFAKLLDAMDLRPADLVLDLGCGLGYSTAVVARIVDAVIALEEDESMAAEAELRLAEQGVDNAAVMTGELAGGAAKHGPYDAILVEGAVEQVPEALLAQLAEGGRIGCIFMAGRLGVARIGFKTGQGVIWRDVFNAAAPVVPGFRKVAEFTL